VSSLSFDGTLQGLWQERVDGEFLYRGMSAGDLADGLVPATDPFACIRPRLLALIAGLQVAVRAGFDFVLKEEHFGKVYQIRFSDILCWTERDLGDSGIDFTSSRQNALEYSDCFHGSQLKQNFKTISDQLPEMGNDAALRACLSADTWGLLNEIGGWVSTPGPDCRPVVLWVRRSQAAFNFSGGCLLVGSFDVFRGKILATLAEKGLPPTADTIEDVLPPEDAVFDVRLRRPLALADIHRVEDVTA
jgi:hypothetical protein